MTRRILGLIIAAIGLVIEIIAWWTGVGAIIGLVVAIVGLLIAACGFYFSRKAVEENKIKEDPGRALFSDLKGTSPGGITVSVELLGRLKRVELRPGTLYEGGELWLINEIMAAYQAANYLEFDQAQFAKELNEIPALKAKLEGEATQRDTARRQATARRNDDDDFGQEGILRRP